MGLYHPPSLGSDDTVYSADSIEFCPFQSHASLLACGTYQLVKDDTSNDTSKETASQPNVGSATITIDDSDDDDEDQMKTEKPMLRLGRLLVYEVQGTKDDSRELRNTACIETAAILDMK
ncbi:hypothetical protein BGZ65_005115, partial [Modicella reniformis]